MLRNLSRFPEPHHILTQPNHRWLEVELCQDIIWTDQARQDQSCLLTPVKRQLQLLVATKILGHGITREAGHLKASLVVWGRASSMDKLKNHSGDSVFSYLGIDLKSTSVSASLLLKRSKPSIRGFMVRFTLYVLYIYIYMRTFCSVNAVESVMNNMNGFKQTALCLWWRAHLHWTAQGRVYKVWSEKGVVCLKVIQPKTKMGGGGGGGGKKRRRKCCF